MSVSVSVPVPVWVGAPKPSQYKVSTITAVATISTCIDLDVFYAQLTLGEGTGEEEGGIVFAGMGAHPNVRTRGTRPSTSKKRPSAVAHRFCDHQVTVIYRTPPQAGRPAEFHNIKVFHNGNVQLTGVKSLDAGRLAVSHIALMVMQIALRHPDILPLGLVNAPPRAANFRACLINSDFRAGYVLRRDRLYALLSGPEYNVQCVFETYYPGVKAQFMWNASKALDVRGQDGVCRCGAPCSGKGDGSIAGACRKITMSVFQSGCCIITGAHAYEQLEDAYAFMTAVFVRHHALLARPASHPPLPLPRPPRGA